MIHLTLCVQSKKSLYLRIIKSHCRSFTCSKIHRIHYGSLIKRVIDRGWFSFLGGRNALFYDHTLWQIEEKYRSSVYDILYRHFIHTLALIFGDIWVALLLHQRCTFNDHEPIARAPRQECPSGPWSVKVKYKVNTWCLMNSYENYRLVEEAHVRVFILSWRAIEEAVT